MVQKQGFLTKAFNEFAQKSIVKPVKKRARKEFKAFKKREDLEGIKIPRSLKSALDLGFKEIKKSGFSIKKVNPKLPKVPLPK